MRSILVAGCFIIVVAATTSFTPQRASAAFCAAGVYRAGCVGRNGAVVVRRPVACVHRYIWVNGVRVRRCV